MNSFNHSQKIPLPFLVCFGFVLVLTAYFSEGFHRGDEHYQLLEYANYILGYSSADDLTWEFSARIRPSLQPYIATGFIYVLKLFGVENPHVWAFFLRGVTAALSFFVVKQTVEYFADEVKSIVVLFCFSAFMWFGVYVSVRFSSETWSAIFFMFAFLNFFKHKTNLSLMLVGVMVGLSFQFRYQTALMSLGFFVWLIFIKKLEVRKLLLLLAGFLIVFIACTLIDSMFYKSFIIAPYNYFYVNLIEGKVSSFGESPWYHYVPDLLNKTYFVYGLLILCGFVLYAVKNSRSPVVFLVVPFVVFHSFVGHKEMRFLYPLIYFTPFLMVCAYDVLYSFFKKWKFSNSSFKVIKVVHFGVVGSLLLCTVFYSFSTFVKVRYWLSSNSSENDVLYVIEENPYQRGMPFKFYDMKDEIRVVKIGNTSQIEHGDGVTYLYTSGKTQDQKYKIPENSKLIFQSLPLLLTSFNLNNWVDRTTIGRFYKIENKSL